MLDSLAPARRRLVLSTAAIVAVALVATVVWVVLRSTRSPAKPVAQDSAGPVILVPGYGGSTGGLNQLADRLRGTGRSVVVFDLPGNGTGDLDAQAKALGTAAQSARTTAHAGSVDVVGYSAGGVVARLWARDHGGASIARRIITLGSPHHGTDLAATAGSTLGCPLACQQLEPNSSVLDRLNSGDETPAGPLWVSIWTSVDKVVVPPDSARLDGATNIVLQSVCPSSTVDHGGLPTDALVAGIIARELSGSMTSTFGTGDCASLSS